MEVLRKFNTAVLEAPVKVTVASSLYTLTYEDIDTGDVYVSTASAGSGSVVTFTLNDNYLTYTGRFNAVVTTSASATVASFGLYVVRPYCNIDALATSLSITAEVAVQSEKVARAIIDSEVGRLGFHRKSKEVFGMGMDYLTLNEPITALYKVYENGVLVHDSTDADLNAYRISIDKTSLVPVEDQDKLEYRPVWTERYSAAEFPSGYDYIIDGNFGYPFIPEDIQEACELLVQDIATGNMRFTNRGISEFDNKEFRIKYALGTEQGTGNKTVDKILDNYRSRIVPGVI